MVDESKAELDRIASHFARGARCVLVTGPAGVGKSTLLVAVAASEGAVVRSLRGCATAKDLAARLAADLPLAPGALDGDDRSGAIAAAAAARPAHVFVLDDAEELDGDARALLAAVLAAAPAHRLVVASRIAPRIAGERVVRLEPFAEDDALAFTIERARESAPDYAPDATETAELRALVRELGGLPLALVLAAPRLPLLGARALAKALDAHRGPTSTSASVLDAEIESSLATLSPLARALVEKVALVEGAFDFALFERLGGGASELEAIHACSLLAATRSGGPMRYSLYESVRDVTVRNVVKRGETQALAAAVRSAIVEHAVALAAAVRAGVAGAFADLDALALDVEAAAAALAADDLASAVRAVSALDVVPSAAQRLLPLLDRIELAARSTALHADVLVTRGRAWFQTGDLQRGRADMDAALAAIEGDRPFVEALAASKAALVRVQSGEESAALFARAERAAARTEDRWLHAVLLRDRALAAMRSGRDDDARHDLEDALALEPFGDELGALVRGVLGQLHQHAGELDASLARYREVASMARRAHNETLAAWALATSGAVEIELGLFADARRDLDEALRVATEQRANAFVAVSLVTLGQLAHESGDPARATVLYQRAIPALLRVKQQRGAALALSACAAAEGARGRKEAAAALLDDARRELTSPRPGDEVALDAFAFAALGGDAAEAAAIETRARAVPPSDELRLALRRMRSASASIPPPPPTAALRVARDGAWFETETGRVHLPERSPLRRVLAALLAAHAASPEAALGPRALFDAAWPGERAVPAALANRVKVAVSTLRKAGLRPFLETKGRGYRLDPTATIASEPRD